MEALGELSVGVCAANFSILSKLEPLFNNPKSLSTLKSQKHNKIRGGKRERPRWRGFDGPSCTCSFRAPGGREGPPAGAGRVSAHSPGGTGWRCVVSRFDQNNYTGKGGRTGTGSDVSMLGKKIPIIWQMPPTCNDECSLKKWFVNA